MGTTSILLLVLLAILFSRRNAIQLAQARAFFVFGDSLVDSGNNNYLVTIARADSPPYGIDFPTHRATGRFSNGFNIPDIISEKLESESVMPILSQNLASHELLNGANFASAGIGILNDTGIQFLNVIRMYKQLQYFQDYKKIIISLIGTSQANKLVNEALVLITVGGNDFVNNYYLPLSVRSLEYSIEDYVKFLISEYKNHLEKLYQIGARRVLVTGTGPIGCVPAELAMRGTADGGCSTELQYAASLYNTQLAILINQLNKKIGKTIFIIAKTQEMHMDFIDNPKSYGFTTSKVACCGQGPYNGLGSCTILSNLCANRNHYAFWDAFHPSEKANRLIVQMIFSGSNRYMDPMNLSSMMALGSIM